MPTAKRSSRLTLRLDFSNPFAIRNTVRTYASEIIAGRNRTNLTLHELAEIANVSPGTVWNHEAERIKNPQLRTMASILFALGFKQITLIDSAVEHRLTKIA